MAEGVALIQKYFPELNDGQVSRFRQLYGIYQSWNEKINVISRKDIDKIYLHHVLHSLSIAKVIRFKDGTKVLDAGTGGGFPGIPLAILFPHVKFHLVDSIGKKILVVSEAVKELKLDNVTCEKQRTELLKGKFDFVLSRAVTTLKELKEWTAHLLSKDFFNDMPNGIICLKGGDLENEIADLAKEVKLFPISDFFEEEYFKEKLVVYFIAG